MATSPEPGAGGAAARIRKRKPVAAPDFAGADEADEADGKPPLLPQPCPVTPLGVQGTRLIFLDRLNQIVVATPNQAEKGHLKLWFGNTWLLEHYAERTKDGSYNGKFNQDNVQTALVEDCEAAGIFNPTGAVFGRGAHRYPGDDEQLVLHMGRQVLLVNSPDKHGARGLEPQVRRAGRVRDAEGRESFFPALEALPPPAAEPSSAAEGRALLEEMGRWYWVDPRGSPLLLFGFIGQMFQCGAQEWRSHMWLTGPTASGKTSIQKVIRALLGKWCLFTEDASEAALRQTLGDDTLPVLIDEAEADDRPERLENILSLMKKASSGAKIIRGGQDHKASEFTAQSCFLLSSVLHAAMKGENRNRIAICEMRAIPEDAPAWEPDYTHWRAVGRRMHRRMIEHWPRFTATLAAYKAEIARRGFAGRWRDTYGTLLACADLLLYDHAHDIDAMHIDEGEGPERIAANVARIVPAIERGRVEARSDVERSIAHLMSHQLPGAHGKPPEAVGTWLQRAMTLRAEAGQFATDEPDMVIDEEARAKLKNHGMRVISLTEAQGKLSVRDARAEAWSESWLAVAYATNKPLSEIFKGSEWASGGWLQSLGKLPHARRPVKVRFAGSLDNALLVPLAAFLGDEG